MDRNDNLVNEYGWSDSNAKPSQSYLAEPIRDILKKLQAKKILDLGCGNGAMTHWLQACGFDSIGCDADGGGVAIAAAGRSGAKFHHVGIYESPELIGDSNFDVVISVEVIEHLFSPAALPDFARGILKPGGYLVVTTPYHGWLKNTLISLFGKWDSHHTPLWEGGHIKFWSRDTLTQLLERNGFHVVQFVGAGRIYGLWKSMILVARMSDVRSETENLYLQHEFTC